MSVRGLLLPLTPVYRLGLAIRERRLARGAEPIRRLRFPVVSVGNLSAGGAGKTPLTIALAEALTVRGFQVDVLSRGYGRSGRAVARVRPDGSPEEFGDEPLLIAREARVAVYVGVERYEAGVLAEREAGPGVRGVHILDDGFQHRQLYRDVNLLLLSNRDLNDRLLPAGNLREDLHAVSRATVIAVPGGEPEVEAALRSRGWQGPVWRLRRRMEVPSLDGPVLAFCGIARPEQFFAGLVSAGIDLAGRRAFADHHRYSVADVETLTRQARRMGATTLLTTKKDAVRLKGLRPELPLVTAGLHTEIEDEAAAIDWLASRVSTGYRG